MLGLKSNRLMNLDLEQFAKDFGTKWTSSELMTEVYQAVKDMPYAVGVDYLKGILSPSALASVQQAAQSVVQEMGPEVEFFRVCYIAPEASLQLGQAENIPMEFVRYVSAALAPLLNTSSETKTGKS
jgi:hypothetical protein